MDLHKFAPCKYVAYEEETNDSSGGWGRGGAEKERPAHDA